MPSKSSPTVVASGPEKEPGAMAPKSVEADKTHNPTGGEVGEIAQAVETLKELGFLIPVNELEAFHGRVETTDVAGRWTIDPDFENGGNDSGNRNFNQRPTLYASGFEDALQFGRSRGGDMVRDLVLARFMDDVRNYSDEDRRKWLDRLNQQEKESWEGIENSTGVTHSPGHEKPKVYGADDLDEREIRHEAFSLRRTELEKRDTYWSEIAEDYQISVYDIESEDPTSVVINASFDITKLGMEDLEDNIEKMQWSLEILAPDLDIIIPQELGDQGLAAKQRVLDEYSQRLREAKEGEEPTLSMEDVARIAEDMNLPSELVENLASALNAKAIWLHDERGVTSLFLGRHIAISNRLEDENEPVKDVVTYKDGERKIPVSTVYISALFQQAGIVGEQGRAKSATLGKSLDIVSLFELDKLAASYTPPDDESI